MSIKMTPNQRPLLLLAGLISLMFLSACARENLLEDFDDESEFQFGSSEVSEDEDDLESGIDYNSKFRFFPI